MLVHVEETDGQNGRLFKLRIIFILITFDYFSLTSNQLASLLIQTNIDSVSLKSIVSLSCLFLIYLLFIFAT